MAYATGTAADYTDLRDKLVTFLTTNAALVAAGQQWQLVFTGAGAFAQDRVLKGPGLSNTDQIYVGLRLTVDTINDQYALWLHGMTGLLAGPSIVDHINVSPRVGMYLDENPMQYWFIASGRRFMVVLKISTVFQSCYGGFFLPYANPVTYPYPLFIGGSRGTVQAAGQDWRSLAEGHSHFAASYYDVNNDVSAYMIDPLGQWLRVWSRGGVPPSPSIGMGPENLFDGFFTAKGPVTAANVGYDTYRQRMRDSFGGLFTLAPCTLVQQTPADQTFGVLDGVFRVSGAGNSSENIIQFNGVDHLVIQNVFRTDVGSYWAAALE